MFLKGPFHDPEMLCLWHSSIDIIGEISLFSNHQLILRLHLWVIHVLLYSTVAHATMLYIFQVNMINCQLGNYFSPNKWICKKYFTCRGLGAGRGPKVVWVWTLWMWGFCRCKKSQLFWRKMEGRYEAVDHEMDKGTYKALKMLHLKLS